MRSKRYAYRQNSKDKKIIDMCIKQDRFIHIHTDQKKISYRNIVLAFQLEIERSMPP